MTNSTEGTPVASDPSTAPAAPPVASAPAPDPAAPSSTPAPALSVVPPAPAGETLHPTAPSAVPYGAGATPPKEGEVEVVLKEESASMMDTLTAHLRLIKTRYDEADIDRMVAWYALEGISRVYNQNLTTLAAEGLTPELRALLDAQTQQPRMTWDSEARAVKIQYGEASS